MDLSLRPMSTSQVLDRTFSLYKKNFVLFAGIAVITPALALIAQLVQLKMLGVMTPPTPENMTPQVMQQFFLRIAISSIIGMIVYLIGTSLASSATAYAVSMVHLGKTTTIAESYKKVVSSFPRIIWLFFSISVISFGPFFLFYGVMIGLIFLLSTQAKNGSPPMGAAIGIMVLALLMLVGVALACVWMIYVFCRYAFAVTACILEKLSASQAMKRSRFLTNDAKWSVLGIAILTAVISICLTLALEVPAFLIPGSLTPGAGVSPVRTIWLLIAQFLGGTFAGPITTVALVVMYYNQRVRKEAFDLQLMMEAVGQQAQMQAAAVAAGALAPPPPPIAG
jgi:hypothetical protein